MKKILLFVLVITFSCLGCRETLTIPNNLNFGFLPSESMKIYDEIDPLSTKRIAEGAILEGKEDLDRVKIVDSEQIKPEVQVINSNLSTLIEGNNDFASAMYNLLKEKNDKNLVYSPYSISLVMGMVYAGAKNTTATQIADAMCYRLDQNDLHSTFNSLSKTLATYTSGKNTFSLKIVNDLWVQKDYDLLESYKATLAKNYGSYPQNLNFFESPELSRITINDYIYNQTNNLIKNLIPEGAIDPFTRLILTNAIYFKAQWQEPFNKNETYDGIFILGNNEKVTVPMMNLTSHFKYGENSNYQIIELPYKDSGIVMTILLPKGPSDLEKELNINSLKEILNTMTIQNIHLQMPKFKFESVINLNEALSNLGMDIAFGPEADFSGITLFEKLYLGAVLQKALIIVDEEGTEAAAATAAIFKCTCVPYPVETMIIDHPFIFFVRDTNTESILFMGKVLNPLK